MKDQILNNGEIAIFVGYDDWSRPLYKIRDIKVVSTEFDGSHLHTINDWGEPMSALKQEFQPKMEDN